MTSPAPIERDADLAAAMLERGTGCFEADARHVRAVLTEFDWYALAGTRAERLLHETVTRLVSCDEFGALLDAGQTKSPTAG